MDVPAMALAKTVWKAAKNQFKYMLAMNDVIVKAEKQMELSETEKEILPKMKGQKVFFEYAGAEFELNSQEFWRLFTQPSLEVMLHYSVNSYTDKPIQI